MIWPHTRNRSFASALFGVFLVFAAWSLISSGPLCAAERPNFLIMISDDQTWTDNGCYGNAVVETPNIDGLARRGLRFTRAFTATAMCAPGEDLLAGLGRASQDRCPCRPVRSAIPAPSGRRALRRAKRPVRA